MADERRRARQGAFGHTDADAGEWADVLAAREFAPDAPATGGKPSWRRPRTGGASGPRRRPQAGHQPSELLVYRESDETIYTYEKLPAGKARIVRCRTMAKRLVVPERIDGLLVAEIAPGAFAGLAHTRSIDCPPGVRRIAAAAFSECPQLRRLAFPAKMSDLSASATWLLGSTQLEDVVLPGAATGYDEDFLTSFQPTRVMLGSKVRRFRVPERWCETLRELAVDADNPWLSTDGACLYSRDGKKLLSVAVHSPVCTVADGCQQIARKAFTGSVELRSVNLPGSLLEIGAQAFAETGLIGVDIPGTVQTVGKRAFANCGSLSRVSIGEGVQAVGEEAFAHCRNLTHVGIPATVRELGARVTLDTAVSLGCGKAGLRIDGANAHVFADEQGVLYRRLLPTEEQALESPAAGGTDVSCAGGSDDLVLLDANALQEGNYRVLDGTRKISGKAFRKNEHVRRVELPEGLLEIGEQAFAECAALVEVAMPGTVRSIADRAFFDSGLESVQIPAALRYLGERAFGRSENGLPEGRSPLRSCQVQPGNQRFFMHCGLLCERLDDGEVKRGAAGAGESPVIRVIQYVGPDAAVRLPEGTRVVDGFAFAGARGVKSLFIPQGIRQAGTAAFAIFGACETIEVQRLRAWHGQTSVVVHPPCDWSGMFAVRGALANDPLDAKGLMAACDGAVLSSQKPLVRAQYMLWRLTESLYLAPDMRKRYRKAISSELVSMCKALAGANDQAAIQALFDLGFITEANATKIIDAAQSWGNVAITAQLLQLKRERFENADDFSL